MFPPVFSGSQLFCLLHKYHHPINWAFITKGQHNSRLDTSATAIEWSVNYYFAWMLVPDCLFCAVLMLRSHINDLSWFSRVLKGKLISSCKDSTMLSGPAKKPQRFSLTMHKIKLYPGTQIEALTVIEVYALRSWVLPCRSWSSGKHRRDTVSSWRT